MANRQLSRVIVMPLTSNTGRLYPGEAPVQIDGRTSKAMADQLMAADKSRLKSKWGAVSKAELALVEDAIALHLGMKR